MTIPILLPLLTILYSLSEQHVDYNKIVHRKEDIIYVAKYPIRALYGVTLCLIHAIWVSWYTHQLVFLLLFHASIFWPVFNISLNLRRELPWWYFNKKAIPDKWLRDKPVIMIAFLYIWFLGCSAYAYYHYLLFPFDFLR
jgi:hypothetical protein